MAFISDIIFRIHTVAVHRERVHDHFCIRIRSKSARNPVVIIIDNSDLRWIFNYVLAYFFIFMPSVRNPGHFMKTSPIYYFSLWHTSHTFYVVGIWCKFNICLFWFTANCLFHTRIRQNKTNSICTAIIHFRFLFRKWETVHPVTTESKRDGSADFGIGWKMLAKESSTISPCHELKQLDTS